MSEKTPRFLVESVPGHVEQVRLALTDSLEYCKQAGIAKIVLVVPALQHLQTTVIAKVLGADGVKALANDRALMVSDSTTTVSVTSATKVASAEADSFLLAVHLALSDMGKVDDSLTAAAIAYCPWTEGDGKQWLKTWEPEVWGNRTWQVAALNLDPAVESALDSINTRVNVSSALTHPADKDFATTTFKTLKKQGFPIDVDDVRIWALRRGWNQSAVEALSKVAKKFES